MSLFTRRDFLATTSGAASGLMFGARALGASSPSVLPMSALRGGRVAMDFLPEATAPLYLQTLASAATEAAHGAGATYADVRVAERHMLHVGPGYPPTSPGVYLRVTFTYGIRVLVDGQWTFAHGTEPTTEAISTTASRCRGRGTWRGEVAPATT